MVLNTADVLEGGSSFDLTSTTTYVDKSATLLLFPPLLCFFCFPSFSFPLIRLKLAFFLFRFEVILDSIVGPVWRIHTHRYDTHIHGPTLGKTGEILLAVYDCFDMMCESGGVARGLVTYAVYKLCLALLYPSLCLTYLTGSALQVSGTSTFYAGFSAYDAAKAQLTGRLCVCVYVYLRVFSLCLSSSRIQILFETFCVDRSKRSFMDYLLCP